MIQEKANGKVRNLNALIHFIAFTTETLSSLLKYYFFLCSLRLRSYQGNLGYFEKSGFRFSTKASRPSFASSDK